MYSSGGGKAPFRYYYGTCPDEDSEEDEKKCPPIFEDDEEIPVNVERRRARSPIVRIRRLMVEEDVLRRNFGDYDPVKNISQAGEEDMMRRSTWYGTSRYVPQKLLARRVIYKGISSSDVKANVRKKQREERRQSKAARREFEWCNVKKDQEEECSQFEEHWIRRDPATAEPAYPCKNERTYSNVTRGTSGNTRRETSKSYKRTFSEAEVTSTSQANVRRRRSQSSWMEYTKGTGFFRDDQRSDSKDEYCVRRSEFAPPYPVEYGYRTSSHDQAPKSSKHTSEFGQNERLFCEKITELNYFHRLRRLPIPDKYGIFFGYELEFWPCDDPDMKETVWGNELENLFAAKDSAFAAGLMKLGETNNMSDHEQFDVNYDEGVEEMQQKGRIPASSCRPIRDNNVQDKYIPYEMRKGREVLVEYYRRGQSGNTPYTSESGFQFENASKSYNNDKLNYVESGKNQNYFNKDEQYAESIKPDENESDEEDVKYNQRYGANDFDLQSDHTRKYVSKNAEYYPRPHGSVPEIHNRFQCDKAQEDYGDVITVEDSSDDEEEGEVRDGPNFEVVTSVSTKQQGQRPNDSFKIAIPRDPPRSITHPKRNPGKFKLSRRFRF